MGAKSLFAPSSFDPAVTAAAARFCFDRRNIIDGIIVSGDLAATGKPIDLKVAKSFLDEGSIGNPYTNFYSPSLVGTGRSIYFLPGNHDKYADDTGAPGSPYFDLMFEHRMLNKHGSVGWWKRQKPSSDTYLACVYADFSLRQISDAHNPALYHGQGKVYSDVLGDLITFTRALKNELSNVELMWLIHFAPFTCSAKLHLEDWQDIIQEAERLGVRFTLCGHTHEQHKIERDRHTVYCSGSAGSVDPVGESRIHIMEFDIASKKINRQNYEYSASDQVFNHVSND